MSSPSEPPVSLAISGNGPTSWRFGLVAFCIAMGVLLVSALFGMNEYANEKQHLLQATDTNMRRFEQIFIDVSKAKLDSLTLANSVLMQNEQIVSAFTKRDRKALAELTVPYFRDVLKPRFGVAQFNFYQPPASFFFRVHNPGRYGDDASDYRAIIVTAGRDRIAREGYELGAAGPGLRAVSPLLQGGQLVGIIELGGDISEPLAAAERATGLSYAFANDKAAHEMARLVVDPKKELQIGSDVFIQFSSPSIAVMLRTLKFNSRQSGPVLISHEDRILLVHGFPLHDFAGHTPSRIFTIADLSDEFNRVLIQVAIRTLIFASVALIALLLLLYNFYQNRSRFHYALLGRTRELEAQLKDYNQLKNRESEFELMKRGFLSNVVTAISEPLLGLSGRLKSCLSVIQIQLRSDLAVPERQSLLDQLRFIENETENFVGIIDKFHQVELFHQGLVHGKAERVDLLGIIQASLTQARAPGHSMPQLEIAVSLPKTLSAVRGDTFMLRRAFDSLFGFAVALRTEGRISFSVAESPEGQIYGSLAGLAFAQSNLNCSELLDEVLHLLTSIERPIGDPLLWQRSAELAIARMTFEFHGGGLSALSEGDGFAFELPALR